MKRLDLRPSTDGELCIWEMPEEGREYVIGCDPSLGREWSDGADKSSIAVFKRCLGKRIEQVAEWYARWPIGRVGEVIATLGRAYGGWVDEDGQEHDCAIINIERNIMDNAKYGLVDNQKYPEQFLFIPQENRQIMPGQPKVYFTNKHSNSQHYLTNTLIDYIDRGAITIRSKPSVDELRSLEKNERGDVFTRGKDRSVAIMMAVIADHESGPCKDYAADAARNMVPKEAPYGMDPVVWKRMHGLDKERVHFKKYGQWENERA